MIYLAYSVGIIAVITMAVVFTKIIFSFGAEFQSKHHSH